MKTKNNNINKDNCKSKLSEKQLEKIAAGKITPPKIREVD